MDFKSEKKWIDKNWLDIKYKYEAFHGYKELIGINKELFTERTGLQVTTYYADEECSVISHFLFSITSLEKWFLAKIKYGFN
jgi:hypothetical protein